MRTLSGVCPCCGVTMISVVRIHRDRLLTMMGRFDATLQLVVLAILTRLSWFTWTEKTAVLLSWSRP